MGTQWRRDLVRPPENEGVLKELLFLKNPVKPIIEVEAHLLN